MFDSWLGILYIFPQHKTIMNFSNIQNKVNQTVQSVVNNEYVKQFVMFIITAVAVIVGVAQFVKRSWVENDMSTKVRNATVTVLSFVNNISGVTLEALSTDSPKAI